MSIDLNQRGTHLGVLGFPTSKAIVSSDDVAKAYRRAQLKWHPDKYSDCTIPFSFFCSLFSPSLPR